MPSHFYFDLDGTLTDPYEGITKCILYALDELGFPHPTDDYLFNCIGPSLYITFPEMVGEELTPRAIELYRERFNDVGWLENVPYEGIHDALAKIATTDCVMFVATAKPRIAASRIIEHFDMGRYFAKVYGCELDGTRANKADLLSFAIDENPGAVSRTMIGDREHDLIAATANHMIPVGVSYGYGSVEELEIAGAASIAASPGELPGLLA
ncbi:MAG: HAD hydrolase-like protein [Proteobacteria bacterium]|nr:HAD hydrolase-like protein [Pseudomonadota bacterium]